MTEAPIPSENEQEEELTLWADGVAEVLDRRELPELAVLFRALARRDGVVVDEALALCSAGTLEGLIEILADEIEERRDEGEARAAEILEELLERALDAHERAPLEDDDGNGDELPA